MFCCDVVVWCNTSCKKNLILFYHFAYMMSSNLFSSFFHFPLSYNTNYYTYCLSKTHLPFSSSLLLSSLHITLHLTQAVLPTHIQIWCTLYRKAFTSLVFFSCLLNVFISKVLCCSTALQFTRWDKKKYWIAHTLLQHIFYRFQTISTQFKLQNHKNEQEEQSTFRLELCSS